jgi:membrane fusion protein (multidrug efflux system)
MRQRKKVLITSVALFSAIGAAWFVCNSVLYENTANAQIDGHITRLSARINGQVEQVDVVEGQLIRTGDVLAVIDQKEYGIAVSQALANLAYADNTAACSHFNTAITMISAYGALDFAQAAVKNAEAEVAAAKHKLLADQAMLERAQANTIKIDSSEQIARKEVIASRRYDSALAPLKTNRAAMNSAEAVVAADQQAFLQAQRKLQQARADLRNAHTAPQQVSLGNAKAQAAEAQVLQRQAQLVQAQLNLSYTIIRSPLTGIVGKRQIEVGQNVSVGQELIDIVSLDDVWITANFKETQLVHLRPGEPVEIRVDAYGRTWKGHLTNVGGAAGSVFSVRPPRDTTGKSAKVVQWVPVRIDFDRPQSQHFNAEGLLKPGLSVEPEVRVRWLSRTHSPDRLPTGGGLNLGSLASSYRLLPLMVAPRQ